MKRINGFIRTINVSEHVAHHLVGEDHTIGHQRIVGVFVMVIGVSIAKGLPIINHAFIIHLVGDIIGYALHGIGLIPFASRLEKQIKK